MSSAATAPRRYASQHRRADRRPSIHIIVVVVSPTTLPAPPALDAATIAGEIADVHLLEQRVRHRAADHRRRDVVEERRQHEDHHQQDEAAFPVVRQHARQRERDVALLEMPRQQREAEQQASEIRESHPFVRQMGRQSLRDPLHRETIRR